MLQTNVAVFIENWTVSQTNVAVFIKNWTVRNYRKLIFPHVTKNEKN